MRQAERLDLRRIRVLLRARDIPAALSLVDALVDPPRRQETETSQLPLPAIGDVFRCPRTACWLSVQDCLIRRSRIWPSGGGKGRHRNAECQTCGVGAEYAERCPQFVPPPSTIPAEVLSPSARMAKRARALVGLSDDEPVTYDPVRIAAGMTPDDKLPL